MAAMEENPYESPKVPTPESVRKVSRIGIGKYEVGCIVVLAALAAFALMELAIVKLGERKSQSNVQQGPEKSTDSHP